MNCPTKVTVIEMDEDFTIEYEIDLTDLPDLLNAARNQPKTLHLDYALPEDSLSGSLEDLYDDPCRPGIRKVKDRYWN